MACSGSLSSPDTDPDEGVTDMAISLPLFFVDALGLVEKDGFGTGAIDH